jgi:hypothetical protein
MPPMFFNLDLDESEWVISLSGHFIAWTLSLVDSSWNVMAHGDAQEEKQRGNLITKNAFLKVM